MALPTQRFSYQQTAHDRSDACLDSNAYGFDNDTPTSILDSSILDSEMIQHPGAGSRFRKDSFATSHGMLTPADSHAWNSQYQDSPIQAAGAFKPDHNQYIDNIEQQQHQHHAMSNNVWALAPRSAHDTTPTALEMMPPPSHYDGMHYMQSKMDLARPFESHQYANIQAEPRFMPTSHAQPSMSAHDGTEYMVLAQAEVESRPMSKRLRGNSSPRPWMDLHRLDGGIQKKNKRIDIPHERNIQTIDQLIETTKDEDLLKELKAQKRLLRNREAALASRQRKKRHTEDLESKEKIHQNQVSILEQQIESLSIQQDELEQQRQILIHHNQEKQHIIESMQMERRDMLMKHTEETASLRRKVQVLTEQLDSAPAPAMSAAPSSTGFTDFNAEMEALNMGTHDWDNFLFMSDSQGDDATEVGFGTPHREPKSSSLEKTPTAVSTSDKATTEQPVASGLLFMLLLFGAFVASKPASTTNIDLPPMPENVRLAAPTVLSNLLSEGSNARPTTMNPAASLQHTVPHRSSNRMRQIHRSLTAPTRQQEIDSAFSLTTSHYASLTDTDLPLHDDSRSTAPQRTLAQAFTESNLPATENKAEIYTRSLLWEHIPRDVVNQFRELVQDHQDLMTQEH